MAGKVGEGGGTSSFESGDVPTGRPPSTSLFILSLRSGQGPVGKAGERGERQAAGLRVREAGRRLESQRGRQAERQASRPVDRQGWRAEVGRQRGYFWRRLAALPPLVIGILSPSA